jgi:PDZ domain-containing secreted protein
MKANGLLLPDSTTLTPLKDTATAAPVLPKKLATDDETNTKKNSTMNSNNNNNNNNNNNINNNNSDDKRKLNQDLNRCLKETVDAIFSPNSPSLITDNDRNKMNSADDEVTLIKVNPLKDESAIKEEIKKELPEDDVKIEIVKQEIKHEQTDANAEDFDPMKVLEWKDGIGTLPGSNLKVH